MPHPNHSRKRTALVHFGRHRTDSFVVFFSGFPDLLLIVGLAPVCGLSAEFVSSRVLPGVAMSVLVGNLFYAWQARRLAARTGRDDVTAIPFGVNTPTIFAYVFLIMGPVYTRTHSAFDAWQAGVFASFISGLVQTGGAFCTDWLRRHTPRAALLCPLAGLALAYLCLGFVFGVFAQAAIALLPMIGLVCHALRIAATVALARSSRSSCDWPGRESSSPYCVRFIFITCRCLPLEAPALHLTHSVNILLLSPQPRVVELLLTRHSAPGIALYPGLLQILENGKSQATTSTPDRLC